MLTGKWIAWLSLTAICIGLGLLLMVQLRTQSTVQRTVRSESWEFVVADLIDNNTRLREQTEALQAQLDELQDIEGGGAVLQSLVNEVNHLRIANGLIEVSGQGVEVVVAGPVSVLDLHDLINELRSGGAEALALNGQRIVLWSAISADGEHMTVDGQPVQPPYRLQAIGDAHTLEVALVRPGGLVSLLEQANRSTSITVFRRDKLTLPVYTEPLQFVYAMPVD
jgi:uncharacterized protein YlxW (UPF0749 family)